MGISREQALDCFESDDLIGIGMEADAIRRRLHPEGVVSYAIDGSIVCSTALDVEEQVRTILDRGGSGVALRGTNGLGLDEVMGVLVALRRAAPAMSVQGLSATEMVRLAAAEGTSLEGCLLRLREAGLDTLAADDAGILDDGVTQPGRCTAREWIEAHRTAHQLGLRTMAAMTFGMGETLAQRVHHLEALWTLQEETGGFASFTPLCYHPVRGEAGLEEPTAVEYLQTLAISRMVLDNIDHVQADWMTQGLKVLQMGLRFGANDVGSVEAEERPRAGATEEELRRTIRDAGFRPVERDALYRTMFLN